MTHFLPRSFPDTRMRRMRRHAWVRDMVQENHVSVNDLIWPLFVLDGNNRSEAIASMPDVTRDSIDLTLKKVEKAANLGIKCIALFPVIDKELKDEFGTEAANPDNLMCRTIRALKQEFPDIGLLGDVALDPYTSHGHDGILDENGYVLNDDTVEALIHQTLVQAEAGIDIIAPSDMMDGRIGLLRQSLDEEGHDHVMLMAYSAKYASAFYGPFRDAVGSSGMLKGDKKTYQMNPANSAEALHEVALDIHEGADMVMVKPGLPYLDIIRQVKDGFSVPTFAYHVSGEYAMLKAAGQNGWIDYTKCMMETMTAFKRAGCDGILTYCAVEIAEYLKNSK